MIYFISTNNVYDFINNKIYISPELFINRQGIIDKSNIFSIAILILRLGSIWNEIHIKEDTI